MHPRARRLLGWIFILTFFLVAPAIILSTAGYRYNFTKKRLERTGVLYVDSVPAGASIGLSGQARKERTPGRLSRLLPGAYDIRLERAGYRPWQKRVEVFSNSTTFLADVALFRDVLTTLAYEAEPVRAAIAPDARRTAVVVEAETGYELRIFDARNGKPMLAYRSQDLAAPGLRLEWSPDSHRLLIALPIGRRIEYLLWNDAAPERPTSVSDAAGFDPIQAFWSEDGRTLYAADATGLYGLDLRDGEVASLGPGGAGLSVVNGRAYAVGADATGRPTLVGRALRDEVFVPLAALPAADARPVPGFGRRVIYASPSTGKMLIANPSPGPDAPSAFEARGASGVWSADGKRFLYWNDFELHEYDAENDTDTLLTRVSTPIVGANWLRGANALLYATSDGFYAVEARGGADRVMTALAAFESLQGFATDRTGDAAVLVGKIGRQSGVWTLDLR